MARCPGGTQAWGNGPSATADAWRVEAKLAGRLETCHDQSTAASGRTFLGKGGYVHQVVPSPETLLCMHATDILHSNLHNILHTRQRAGPASASGSRIQPGRANEELRWQAPVLTRVPSGSNVSFGQICPHERLREAARLVAACTSRVRRLPARPRRHARCRGRFPGTLLILARRAGRIKKRDAVAG